jgi:hypothetical protein
MCMWTDQVNWKWPDLSAQVCNCFLSYFVWEKSEVLYRHRKWMRLSPSVKEIPKWSGCASQCPVTPASVYKLLSQVWMIFVIYCAVLKSTVIIHVIELACVQAQVDLCMLTTLVIPTIEKAMLLFLHLLQHGVLWILQGFLVIIWLSKVT